MKQAYEKVYDMYGYSFQKVETTGKCKKITGGVEEEETHYVQVQRKLFGIPVWKTWVPIENIKWCGPSVETIYECNCRYGNKNQTKTNQQELISEINSGIYSDE